MRTGSITARTWDFPENFLLPEGYSPPCTGAVSGRCVNMQDLQRPRRRISDTNIFFDHGQTGLSVAFDLPTQIGYDSDHSLAEGEVGKVGVAIDTLKDMEILFDGIPLDKVSTSMTINSTAAILLAMYIAMAEKQGVKPEALQGTIQNDILKEYAARGTYIYPPLESMRIITDIFAFCKDHLPRWNTINISGYHMREAGCTAVQEVAFTLADGITYVEAAIRAGLDVDSFASRVAFFFCCHNTFIEEIAKFRAARRLWAKIMKERFKAKRDESCMLRFHTQTAGCSLTAQQPDNNVVRVAFQALAAVLGGTQSLHTNSRDEAYALPTEDSVRIALRTQQIIAHESGVAEMVDPLGGSYAVEALTSEIEKKATEYIKKIEAMGGAIKAIESGYIQGEIAESAYQYQKEIESQEADHCWPEPISDRRKSLSRISLRIQPEMERYQKEKLSRAEEGEKRCKGERNLGRPEESCPGNRQFDAAHPGGSQGLCHPGRDIRYPAGSVWGIPAEIKLEIANCRFQIEEG